MARGVARLGDTTQGTCSHSSHASPIETTGKIITASGNVSANNRKVARLGDTVETDCGHTSIIITASGNTSTNRHTARLGDKIGDGPYDAVIITASPNVFCN
jgi:uncharacterized Zn-binding protein involved in type VI secretion